MLRVVPLNHWFREFGTFILRILTTLNDVPWIVTCSYIQERILWFNSEYSTQLSGLGYE